MLVLEGPDQMGKTTIAKRLCQLGDWEYRHMTIRPAGWRFPEDYYELIQPGVVQDRFHLGAYAYQGFLFDRMGVWERIKATGGMIVLITADPRFLLKRWNRDRHEMFPAKKVLDANCRFQECENDIHFHLDERHDWISDDVVQEIADEYQRLQRAYRKANATRTSTG
jgi:thymidylate kinase